MKKFNIHDFEYKTLSLHPKLFILEGSDQFLISKALNKIKLIHVNYSYIYAENENQLLNELSKVNPIIKTIIIDDFNNCKGLKTKLKEFFLNDLDKIYVLLIRDLKGKFFDILKNKWILIDCKKIKSYSPDLIKYIQFRCFTHKINLDGESIKFIIKEYANNLFMIENLIVNLSMIKEMPSLKTIKLLVCTNNSEITNLLNSMVLKNHKDTYEYFYKIKHLNYFDIFNSILYRFLKLYKIKKQGIIDVESTPSFLIKNESKFLIIQAKKWKISELIEILKNLRELEIPIKSNDSNVYSYFNLFFIKFFKI